MYTNGQKTTNLLRHIQRLLSWIASLRHLSLPGQCLLCGTSAGADSGICLECLSDLPWPQQPCRHCGEEMGPDADSSWCERCLLMPPLFDQCIPLFRYAFPARELITQFKFRAGFAAGRALGILLAERLDAMATADLPEALVPVPLHQQRLRQRGFNQSALLARTLSTCSGVPVINCATRIRATATQRTLHAAARRNNLKGAFTVDASMLQGIQHVAIVDDVMTTMNTANSLALALRREGVERIDVLCVARVS